jgi:glycosyltransferase involved in cell wall biosynthesis
MHIGFLTPEYVGAGRVDGGLANYLRKTGQALAARGHHVSVLVLSDRHASWQDGEVDVTEVKQVALPRRLNGTLLALLGQLVSYRRLARVAWRLHARAPFDIFQASNYWAPGYALRRNARVPLVCRMSTYTPLWRSAYGRPTSFGEYLSDWLEIRQVIDAEAAFAPSDFIAKAFARLHRIQPSVLRSPVDVAPPSSDDSFFRSHLEGLRYLLFFGTLSRIKGVDLLAPALPNVLTRHESLHVVFVGRDDGLGNGVKTFDHLGAMGHDVRDRLHYFAPVPRAQLGPVIANAVGVLVPSRVDNYPNACLEAQAMGVPVVGTFGSSLDEMIEDGKTGFLAQNGSATSLEGAIERLLALGPAQREEMRGRILGLVAQISGEDRIGQLVQFYEAVISRFRSPGVTLGDGGSSHS